MNPGVFSGKSQSRRLLLVHARRAAQSRGVIGMCDRMIAANHALQCQLEVMLKNVRDAQKRNAEQQNTIKAWIAQQREQQAARSEGPRLNAHALSRKIFTETHLQSLLLAPQSFAETQCDRRTQDRWWYNAERPEGGIRETPGVTPRWSASEDAALLVALQDAVLENPPQGVRSAAKGLEDAMRGTLPDGWEDAVDWRKLSAEGPGRSAVCCRIRALHHLVPAGPRWDEPWTKAEDEVLVRAVQETGVWEEVAERVRRSAAACFFHYQQCLNPDMTPEVTENNVG